jgi:hypothetical protein
MKEALASMWNPINKYLCASRQTLIPAGESNDNNNTEARQTWTMEYTGLDRS